jgi:hypothetical protein
MVTPRLEKAVKQSRIDIVTTIYYQGWVTRRSTSLAAAALAGAAVLFTAPRAGAVDLTGAGGMGLNIWSMAVRLSEAERLHQGVGLGINGRVMMKVGDHFRIQAGLIQGRFTEDDDSAIKRNLIFLAVEGVQPVTRRVYASLGLRVGADHVALIETLAREGAGTRLVRDADRWSVLWHPFATIGVLVGRKYHMELESGAAFAYTDSQVYISYTITLGIYFGFGGR